MGGGVAKVPTAGGTRCGVELLDQDVHAGNRWGATRVGRGDVAAVVGATIMG